MIPFRQYMRPNGRQVETGIDRPEEIEAKAQAIIEAGHRFELEHLGTALGLPDVSLTIFNLEKEMDVAIELCRNGPEVPAAVDKLILEFNL